MIQIFPQLTKIPIPMKRIAVVIGHDKTSPGFYSKFLKTSEYIYNSEVATHLSKIADIYKRPIGGGYKTKMKKLAAKLNPKNYDLVIELHFNAYDGISNKKGHGVETVSYPGSKSLEFGDAYCKAISKNYGVFNRGAKVHYKGDRGWPFLSLMNAPAIIVEPFFGDEDEALKFSAPAKYAGILTELFCN